MRELMTWFSGQRTTARVMIWVLLLPLLTASLFIESLHAEEFKSMVDPFDLEPEHRTVIGLYLTSKEAHKYLENDPSILLIDARSRAEVNFIGMPDLADANVPFAELHPGYRLGDDGSFYNRVRNEYFTEAVRDLIQRKGLSPDPVIFVLCRAGYGAARAVNELADHGFTRVHSIIDGFEGDLDPNGKRTVNGWRNSGLPWSYGIHEKRAYRMPITEIEAQLSANTKDAKPEAERAN